MSNLSNRERGGQRLKVAFPYIAQTHHIPHSIAVAFRLATNYPRLAVSIIVPTVEHLNVARQLALDYPRADCTFVVTSLPAWYRCLCGLLRHRIFETLGMLIFNRALFSGFDALVVPERTSLLLKRLGVNSTRFIHTFHGAGDRERGFESRIGQFDFLLLPGQKHADRLLKAHLARPDAYAITGYLKFDLYGTNMRPPPVLFPNSRPIVLYNPHCSAKLGSWPAWGRAVLDYFAQSQEFNFIFAPHVKLFDRAPTRVLRELERYKDFPHMLIDAGSSASINMTYTRAADLYIGDVSSQVYEFLVSPRPCLFLNSGRVSWRGDANYLCWECGPVVDDIRALDGTLHAALHTHKDYLDAQSKCVEYTFGNSWTGASDRAARAIATYLNVA